MTTPVFSPIRPAGRLETTDVVRNVLGVYTSVMIGAKYHSSSGKLDKNTLYPALQRVVRRVPALRTALFNTRDPISSPIYASCEVDEGVLDKICAFRDDVRWDDEDATGLTRFLETELGNGYDTDDISIPLWRVVVFGENTVLFFYHHAIGDGKSGLAFHALLLEALNSNATHPPHQFTPSIEDLVDVRPSIGKILGSLFSRYFMPASWSKLPTIWTGNPTPSLPVEYNEAPKDKLTSFGIKLQTRIELLELSAAEADKLLVVCRKHNSTITSALYTMAVAIISQVVMKDINTAPNTPFSRLSTHVPVSLRPLSGVPEIAFCEHTSTWHNVPDLQPEFRWEDAKAHTATLKSTLKEGKVEQELGLLWLHFGNYVDFYQRRMGKKRGSTFEMSSLGKFPTSVDIDDDANAVDDSRWRIGKTVFAQGGGISGPAFGFGVVGHGSGGITVTMSWSSYTIDEELALKIVRSMRAEMKSLVDSDSLPGPLVPLE